MKISNSIKGIAACFGIVLLLGATGCDRDPKFKVKGDIAGGEGKTLILSKADFAGRWIVVDSTHVGKNGEFSFQSASPASPEIYRLSLGDSFIYLPVDSVETIDVETSADKFGVDFKLSGTPQAEQMEAFEKELMKLGTPDSAQLENFKKSVYTKYIQDSHGGIMSYYVLTKIIGDKPLFDASNTSDMRYYAAVATQYDQFRPQDPHGKMVRETSLAGMRKRNSEQGKRRVVEAQEITILDIALPDENDKTRKLSELTGKGKPVVVVFGMMNAQESPAFNRQLAEFKNGHNVDYYHVSLDADQYAWRDAARNLPWVTVIDARGMNSNAMTDYNVTTIPAFYIYDGSGELREKANDFKELEKKLSTL